MFNQTVQILSKLSQTIARESGEANASTEMNSLLQICFDKLRHVQEYLPITLKRNKIILGHLQKFEDGLQKVHQWLTEAKQLINRYSVQIPVKRIEETLEQHRVRWRIEGVGSNEIYCRISLLIWDIIIH